MYPMVQNGIPNAVVRNELMVTSGVVFVKLCIYYLRLIIYYYYSSLGIYKVTLSVQSSHHVLQLCLYVIVALLNVYLVFTKRRSSIKNLCLCIGLRYPGTKTLSYRRFLVHTDIYFAKKFRLFIFG